MTQTRPGSAGEHALQERHGTFKRAAAFYDKQMLDHLNPLMREFVTRQSMAFIATADAHGECDASFRAGPPGFMRVLDERTLIYPEYRGNGVMASLGNIAENAHVGILFVDFFETAVGLHVNGRATAVENDALAAFDGLLARLPGAAPPVDTGDDAKTRPERWVVVSVMEAYIHCSKHIPLLARLDKEIHWGTDDNVRKGGDHFKAKHEPRPWVAAPAKPAAAEPALEAAPAPAAPAEPAPEAAPAPAAPAEPAPEAAPAPAAEPAPAPFVAGVQPATPSVDGSGPWRRCLGWPLSR